MRQIREASLAHSDFSQDAAIQEALRSAYNLGIESVLYIRCVGHIAVPRVNENEHSGGECGACILADLIRTLAERDALRKRIKKTINLIEQSRDGFADGQPYILTYSDIIDELRAALLGEGK